MKKFLGALLLLCMPAFGQTTIRWAGGVVGHSLNPPDATKAPDGKTTEVSSSSYLYLMNFNDRGIRGVSYPLPKKDEKDRDWKSLEQLLGLRDGALRDWDLIAFEGNSQHAAWESSIWFVSDFKGAAAGAYNTDSPENTPVVNPPAKSPLRFMSGQILTANYFNFFHIDASKAVWPAQVAAWILVGVPEGVDVTAPGFKVMLTGALIGNPTHTNPDLDAIGVIVHQK